jgi:primosomal replication protein N
MISILASPKSWKGLAEVHQYNAVKSWLALHPEVEVILYGDAEGTAEACERLGVQHVPHVDATPAGIPYFGAIAEHAAKYARYDLQCYVNCDILFTKSLLNAFQRIPFNQFLMIGQRIDLAEGVSIDVTAPDFLDKLVLLAEAGKAELHTPAGSDYFLFPRGLWQGLPPVVIGRGGYDNALILFSIKKKLPIIDATHMVPAVHQFHGYTHRDNGEHDVFDGVEATMNKYLAGKHHVPTLIDATWCMNHSGLFRNYARGDWFRFLECYSRFIMREEWLGTSIRQIRRIALRFGFSRQRIITMKDLINSYQPNSNFR